MGSLIKTAASMCVILAVYRHYDDIENGVVRIFKKLTEKINQD